MTKEEAKQAIAEGKKITHKYFDSDEFIFLSNNRDPITGAPLYEDELGYCFSPTEFWSHRTSEPFNDGWYEFEYRQDITCP